MNEWHLKIWATWDTKFPSARGMTTFRTFNQCLGQWRQNCEEGRHKVIAGVASHSPRWSEGQSTLMNSSDVKHGMHEQRNRVIQDGPLKTQGGWASGDEIVNTPGRSNCRWEMDRRRRPGKAGKMAAVFGLLLHDPGWCPQLALFHGLLGMVLLLLNS